MTDKHGIEIKAGDKIRVPDNPDVAPIDVGTVFLEKACFSLRNLNPSDADELVFHGRLSITPMSFYKPNEVEIIGAT